MLDGTPLADIKPYVLEHSSWKFVVTNFLDLRSGAFGFWVCTQPDYKGRLAPLLARYASQFTPRVK